MAKVDKLAAVTDFYTAQLHDLDLDTTGAGMVSYTDKNGNQKPVTISGNRLCLPTRELLKEGDWENRVVFHPLAEQFGNSLSPIMNSFKQYIQVSLTSKYMQLIVAIAEVASDPTKHKRLGSKVGKMLSELGDFDEKTFASVRSLVKKVMDKPETRLVNILMRSGVQDKALRSTVITHPIVEGLQEAARDGNNKFLGMSTLRKGDLDPINKLFTLVTGGGEGALYKSNDRTAPYYHSLLQAWISMATHINELIETLGVKIPAIGKITPYTLEWVKKDEAGNDGFAKFASSHHQVASALPGNRPVVEDVDVEVVDDQVDESATRRVYENDDVEVEPTRGDDSETESETTGKKSLSDFLGRSARPRTERVERLRERDTRREPVSVYDNRSRRDRSDRGVGSSRTKRSIDIREFGGSAVRQRRSRDDVPW